MDSQDQRKTAASGHESHGVHLYLCHKCGWPFPNPHPSARHRRAHKRICGTIEGYKLIDSGKQTHSAVSDDEHGSDEDLHTPSPKIEKKSTNEFNSGGVGERSNRSEDEVFSDAVTEFSYSGFSPVNEQRLEGVRVSDKNVENVVEGDPGTNQQFKVDATAGIAQLPNSPTDSSQMHNPEVLETETNLLGSSMPIEDILSSCNSDSVVSSNKKTEELAVGISRVNGSPGDLSYIKSETLTDSPKEANFGDHEMQSSTMLLEQETDVKGCEESNVDEVLADVAVTPSQTTREAFLVACKLQETDLKTSDSVTGDQIVESQEKQILEFGPVMSLHNLSPEVQSCEHMEVLVKTDHIELESARDRDVCSHGNSVGGCCIKGEGNENVHVLSVANIPVVDHPEIMVEDFKDHKAVKLNFPATLDSGEVIEPVVDDNKDTFYEAHSSSFLSSQSGERIHLSSAELHALEGNLKQEDGGNEVLVAEVPVEGADASELNLSSEDLGSNGLEASPETTMSGKIQTDSDLEGQQPHDFHTDPSQDILPESTTMGLSDVIPVAVSADAEVSQKTNLSGGNNAYNHAMEKTEKCDTDGKEILEEVKEELSTNIKTSSEFVDDLFVSQVNQTTKFIGAGNSGDPEKAATEISDLAGNESRDVAMQEKSEVNSRMTLESECNISESKVVIDDGMDKVMNLQETETTTYSVADSSYVAPDASHLGITTQTHSGSQSQQDENSEEAMKEPEFNSKNEVLAECVVGTCEDAKSNSDIGAEVSQKISEIPPEHLPAELGFSMKSFATVDDSHCRDDVLAVSGTSTELLQEEHDENFPKQPIEGPAVDVSVDSISRTDSMEGNWGSVSVLSTQSDAVAAINAEASPSTASKAPAQSEMQKPKSTSEGHHSNNTDVFVPPSFMTLVEGGDGVHQKAASDDIQTVQNAVQPKSEAQALEAGWLPSLNNVVNQSQGRKTNEEIIAKVTNWSTGKQHVPLKSLLGQANLDTKPKSPNPKQTPTVIKKDENTTKSNDGSAATVNSILGPEDQVAAKREMGKEWNSPARYPSDDKKEKRKVKGRPYWVPFVCCYSVN